MLLVALFAAALIYGLVRPNPHRLKSVLVGRPAPVFDTVLLPSFQTSPGERLNLADYLGKRPILVNFWASWCVACRDEAPGLERFYRAHQDQLYIIGVDYQDHVSDAEAFVRRFGLTFPSVSDPRGSIGIDYGTFGVPETFVIDRQGKVLARYPLPLDQQYFDRILAEVGG